MRVDFNRRFFRNVTFLLLLSGAGWSALGLGAFYFYTHKSLPQTRGVARPAGLTAPGVIIRDRFGIPHCYAENRNDLFYLAGYAQAQDRLFQMDLFRRTAAGRMAEWKGKKALGQDRLARTIGFAHLAEAHYKKLPPDSKAVLDAFAAGVNAYAFSGQQALPVEYPPLHAKFEPWQPEDLLAVYLYYLYCATQWPTELVFQAAQGGNQTGVRLLLSSMSYGMDALDSDRYKISPDWVALLAIDRQLRELIGGSCQATGILKKKGIKGTNIGSQFMNIQGPMSLPSIWYGIHLSSPNFDIAGLGIPGFPLIFSGMNKAVSFVSWFDQSDYLKVTGMITEFKDCGSTPEPVYLTETIKYKTPKGTSTETLKFRPSMLTDSLPDNKESAGLYLKWQGAANMDPVRLLLNRAIATDQAGMAAEGNLPHDSFTMAFANRSGEIGYLKFANVAARSFTCCQDLCNLGYGVSRYIPTSGTGEGPTRSHFGTRISPYPPATNAPIANEFFCDDGECLPHAANTIHSPFPPNISGMMARLDADPVSPLKILRDVRLNSLDHLAPVIDVLAKNRDHDDDLERAYLQLKDWNNNFDIDLSAPLIFSEAMHQAMILTYQDEMGAEILPWFLELQEVNNDFYSLLIDPTNTLFDDLRSPKVETRDDILLAAFRRALANLESQYGPRMSQWKWGEAHRLKLRHPLGDEHLGSVLRYFTLARPSPPMPGGRDTIWNGYYNWSGDYSMTAGTSLILVMDLARPDELCVSYAGGQSGQPFSPHYVDLLQYWLRGECVPVDLDRARVEKGAESVLRLLPQGGKDSR